MKLKGSRETGFMLRPKGFEFPFEVIDTGGIDPRRPMNSKQRSDVRAEIAIREADTLVMVVDAHVGITPHGR